MPYNRPYGRYTARPYRRTYIPRRIPGAPSWAATAAKALRMAKNLAGIINSELHSFDVTNTTSISTTGQFTNLTAVAQGDDQVGRTGRSILVKSLLFSSRQALGGSATTDQIRNMIFIDMDPQGTTPTAADLLTADTPIAPRNILSDQNRFKVLWDDRHVLTTGGGSMVSHDKYFRLNNHVKFDGTAGSDTSWGAIWLYQVGTQATDTATQATTCRIRFYDN